MKNGNKLELARMIISAVILIVIIIVVIIFSKNVDKEYVIPLLGIGITLSFIIGGSSLYKFKENLNKYKDNESKV